VVSALKSAMDYSKSMIMVTHRLGVVRALGVNRVIVLERGEIAESGHPEELLRKEDSLYASLAREQGITTSIKTAM
jgi:subfamily B ATP-binding cassette protein HlyB/CyaB